MIGKIWFVQKEALVDESGNGNNGLAGKSGFRTKCIGSKNWISRKTCIIGKNGLVEKIELIGTNRFVQKEALVEESNNGKNGFVG